MNDTTPDGGEERMGLRICVSETLARLSRTGALPALPQAATAALAAARDPDTSAEKLCRIIETDVGLSARVVRAANSVAYARRAPATTLKDAVVAIGLRDTCDILVAASVRRLYGSASRHAEGLWSHALAVAVATQELAKLTRRVDPGAAFLPALFHDAGRIAFLLADGTSFDVIQGLMETGAADRLVLECEWFGFDHAAAGSILAETWGLQREQCDAIRWHHEPTRAEVGRSLAELIGAGDALAYSLGFGGGAVGTMPQLDGLGLSSDDEAACAERVREAFARQ